MARVHKLMAKDLLNSPGVLRHPNGDLTTSHEEAARLLLDTHFPGNVGSNATDRRRWHMELNIHDMDPANDIVTDDRVRWAISSFKTYKSPGLDGIYPIVLLKSWHLIIRKLKAIFRASTGLGYIPKLWQQVR